ncbi:MAG: hypothetical protein F3741_02800 [Nitrospinae bacterium]|nr:hypothetical protein [Nitrospinota bacterium]MZH40906.1 hypothetical protein [Nitrospinota bacterium]
MPKPDIQQLEESVSALLGEFRRLKEENLGLSRRVEQLIRDKEVLVEESKMSQNSQDRISQLESLNLKNEKDRKIIRAKVQTLLDNLQKFDLT